MKKDKRKKIFITSILMIVIVTSIMWIFLKINNKAVEIQASKSEFNTELEENEHMHIEEDINGEKVPVPNGYVGSRADGENEIDTGYVIYEGTEEVNNENVEEAQRTRNQYVWIPVPDASTMYGTDENGKKWGKTYTFTLDTGSNIDEVTGAKPNWSELNGIMQTYGGEPNVVPKKNAEVYDMDSRIKNLYIGEETTHEFLIQMEKEFSQMIESVEKYGGFYIGRYETGIVNQEKLVIRKGETNITGQSWYSIYSKSKSLKNENTNIETGLMWVNQKDRILMWLIESGNKSKEEICKDSSGWGNYKNASFEYININGEKVTKESNVSERIPTGSSEYTKANNIYDLAGNVSEWSMEGSNTYYRTHKGGNFIGDGNATQSQAFYPSSGASYIGSRAMLYIK